MVRRSRASIGAGPVTRVHADDRVQRAGPFSVLLVEDDDGDAVLVEGMLDVLADPIILSWARSLAQAQSLVAGVDCVLLDLGLPDAAGLEGLRLRADSSVCGSSGMHRSGRATLPSGRVNCIPRTRPVMPATLMRPPPTM